MPDGLEQAKPVDETEKSLLDLEVLFEVPSLSAVLEPDSEKVDSEVSDTSSEESEASSE